MPKCHASRSPYATKENQILLFQQKAKKDIRTRSYINTCASLQMVRSIYCSSITLISHRRESTQFERQASAHVYEITDTWIKYSNNYIEPFWYATNSAKKCKRQVRIRIKSMDGGMLFERFCHRFFLLRLGIEHRDNGERISGHCTAHEINNDSFGAKNRSMLKKAKQK